MLTDGGLKMKGKRFTEEQIIFILKEHEAGQMRKHRPWQGGP